VEGQKPPAREATISYGPDKYIRLVTDENGHSTLESEGMKCDDDEPFAAEYNAGIDGIEHLLLALWGLGMDVSTPQFAEAVDTATMLLAEQFPS
jgi:hypothetical protein